MRRLLTEKTLLSLLAGGVGIGLAVWLLDLLATADLPAAAAAAGGARPPSRQKRPRVHARVAVVAGALLGLVPALQSTRPTVASALRSESAGGGHPGQLRWRNALVVTAGFGREPTAILTVLTPATRFTPDEARIYTRPPAGPLPPAARRRRC